MFYDYRQNNSGGRHDYNEIKGITLNVIIEADSAEDANWRAQEIGLYFNGCESGLDCSCCGDRWNELGPREEGDEVPSLYGMPLSHYGSEEDKAGKYYMSPMGWMGANPEVYVHLKDGRILGFVLRDERYVYDGKAGDLPLEIETTHAVKEIES